MKNVRRSLAAAAALALMPGLAAAHNYTYLEGGFLERDTGSDDDAGFRIAGSYDLPAPIAVFGEFSDTGDFEQFSLGALFHNPMTESLDLVFGASMESVDVGPADDTGFGLRGGLRWQLSQFPVEINPEVRYVDVFKEDGTSLRVAALFGLTPQLDLQGAVQGGDEDRIEAGLRYNFGPRQTGR